MCSEPTSLAVLMAKADKYATADSVMRVKVTASDKIVPTPTTPKPAGDNRGGQNNNKRKADQLDSCSNNKLVANMEGDAPATQAGSQWRRTGKNDWQPKLSLRKCLTLPARCTLGRSPLPIPFDSAALHGDYCKERVCSLPQVQLQRLMLRLPGRLRLRHRRLTTTAFSTTTTPIKTELTLSSLARVTTSLASDNACVR
ncbi:hypothetical protein ZWY2020_056260 [Hordeum vulgare]|nr:hypothetical protein ZWY2020_056260 [Hordeum vulgare]